MKGNLNRGLTSIEVEKSRSLYGSNELTKHKKNSFIKLLIESLNDPIIKILLIALAIKLVFLFKDSDIYETIGIFIAVFLASFISSISEYGSEKAFEKLEEENSKINVTALRNNKIQKILIDEVVVGDIILLEPGDKVPADGIIIENEIFVDESSLTGETKEKLKTFDGENKIFRGSIITSKSTKMLVKEVGDKTYYGNIASSIQEKNPESPLKQRLKHLAKIISRMGYFGALLAIVSYLFNVVFVSNNFEIDKILTMINNSSLIVPHIFHALTLGVTIIVVSVPEGLPMMITLVLSSNMNKLIKSNVLVRKLVGIETAGNINILFTDKTGTLTEGKLKVKSLLTSYEKETIKIESLYGKYKELFFLSIVYNNSSFFNDEKKPSGSNITDRALLEYINSDNKSKYKIISEIPFDSKNKYSGVTIDYDLRTTFFKGAYELIISKCAYIYDENGTKKKFDNKLKLLSMIDNETKLGSRCIAFATSSNEKLENLSLVGVAFIKDSIKKETKKGLELVKSAGINVVMLTGDSINTAVSIARETGILSNSDDMILTSEELKSMSDEEIKSKLNKIKVIARSLPQDKNKLVCLSQEMGLVVGMTGDGVNDAPALKRADVGFAMGSGAEVAKEVSDIVIIDDNILSISKAILFGRTIYKSIRKFIMFQLTVNVCALTLSIIGPMIGIMNPVTMMQMLWINMVMDTLAALAFAYEPPLIEYMKEKPKRKDEKIMNRYMKNTIVFSGLYSSIICIIFLKSSFILSIYSEYEYLMTAFFGLFIFLAIFNAFNVRTYRINILSNILKNKIFIVIISLIILIQVLLIYYGGEIFRTTGLTFYEFEIMILVSLSIVPVDFIRKIILRLKGYPRGV